MRTSSTEDEDPAAWRSGIGFDASSGELAGPLGSTRLAPQPAALLGLLLENAGTVVDRERIREHLWPGGRVEFDQGIAFALREIRKALESVGEDPLLVETLPRRGLRLRVRPGPAAEVPGDRRPSRSATRLLGPLAALGILGMAAGVIWSVRDLPPLPVVAILEYAGGGDPSPPAPALGELLTATLTLGLDGTAGVIGPAGTRSLAGPEDVGTARATLGACLLVSGSVRPLGPDSLVVFTQVVRTSDGVHAWAHWDTLTSAGSAGDLAGTVLAGTRRSLGACGRSRPGG